MVDRKVVVEGQITHHGMLATGADFLLREYAERIESKPDGLFYFLLASVMFSAFRVEGSINVIGEKLLGNAWPERLSWREKVKLIFAIRGDNADFGSDPLQTVSKLFKIRDQWAHPKLQLIAGEFQYDPFGPDINDPLIHNMVRIMTLDFAKTCSSEADAFFHKLVDISGVDYFETMTHATERGVS